MKNMRQRILFGLFVKWVLCVISLTSSRQIRSIQHFKNMPRYFTWDFDVLTAEKLSMLVFWLVTSCGLLGRSPTEAFRSRKKSTALNSWRVVIASWSRWWDKCHYELKVWLVADCKVFFFSWSNRSRVASVVEWPLVHQRFGLQSCLKLEVVCSSEALVSACKSTRLCCTEQHSIAVHHSDVIILRE
jgi:hypothetical protein